MTVLSSAPPVGGDLTTALEREKHRFLSRNLERCGYLRVVVEPSVSGNRLVLAASFTLDAARRWHRVEAPLSPAGEAASEPRIAEAFGQLDDGIGAARIAQLFAPLTAAQRQAATRRD